MTTKVSTPDVRQRLGSLLNRVAFGLRDFSGAQEARAPQIQSVMRIGGWRLRCLQILATFRQVSSRDAGAEV